MKCNRVYHKAKLIHKLYGEFHLNSEYIQTTVLYIFEKYTGWYTL